MAGQVYWGLNTYRSNPEIIGDPTSLPWGFKFAFAATEWWRERHCWVRRLWSDYRGQLLQKVVSQRVL